ncbi:class I SAM-dependent methyltransferase [Candidatus Woesearchaeota archaeon]|nr:class I SAM-dependent methyltransferase [Candidatus Woesearchaeota archaeon]
MLTGYFSYLYRDTTEKYRNRLLASIPKVPKGRLLDLGCWDGKNSLMYGKAAGTKEVYGLELVKSLVEKARKNGVKAQCCDLNNKFPFKNEMFDIVVANHVIEHLVNVKGFMSEIRRVLKPGGCALIGTPNLASWHNVAALFLGRQPYSGPTIMPKSEGKGISSSISKKRIKDIFTENYGENMEHIKVMAAKELVLLSRRTGFSSVKVYGFGYYPLPPFLAGMMASFDCSHSHYVVAKVMK